MFENRPFHRADLAIIGLAICFPSVLTWVYFVHLAGAASVIQQAVYAVGKTAQFVLPAFWAVLIRRQQPSLRWPRCRGMGIGALFGVGVVVAMVLLHFFVLVPLELLNDVGQEMRGKAQGFEIDSVGEYVALALFYALIHSLLEEYYWRWFIFGRLRRIGGVGAAAVISSVGFMAHHVILLGNCMHWGATGPGILLIVLGSIAIALGGLFWAYLYHRTGAIWASWLSHLIVDAGIFLLGYNLVRQVFR